MSEISKEIRYIMLFYYKKGKSGAKTCRKICAVYGEDALSERTVQLWFNRFRSGNFDVEDVPRSGRPITGKADEILQLIEVDRHASTQDIADALNIDQKTVWNHLKKAGYSKKLDVWVPHDLTQKNLIDRISISEMLLKRNEIDPFLKQVITGDEKWIKYENKKRRRSWTKAGDPPQTTSKPGLTANKVMLSVWWDCKGIVHYEVLEPGQTIDSALYCQQLTRLQQAIQNKRPELVNRKGVIFHHDNARPHTSLMTRQKLSELGWEVLIHPPYSPDLAPSDYYLFRSLQNFLDGKKLANKTAAANTVAEFFASKPQKFYTDGIMKLSVKWQRVIDNNGQYVLD